MISANTVSRYSGLAPKGGPAFRRSTVGPELTLLEEFLADPCLKSTKRCHVSCFIEPRIDGGYPDAVIAFWDPSICRSWPEARVGLGEDDFRLLQLLSLAGQSTAESLAERFGSPVKRSLERLIAAQTVESDGSTFRAAALEQTFAVRRLVAIEAKMSGSTSGLHQAVRNSWFASESFFLTGTEPSVRLLNEAERMGVGLLTSQTTITKPKLPAIERRLPVSYVSWMFSDWAWRATL